MIRYQSYKETEILSLGVCPSHWVVNRVKSMGVIRYGLGQPPRELENGLPIIRATNIFSGRISSENLILVDPEDLPYERKPILKEGEIIVVRSGAYTGDSAMIPKEFAGAVSGYDMVFTPDKNIISPKFLSYCLLSQYVFKDQLVLTSLRAAQPHLNKEELGSTLITFPSSLEEQTAIAEYLDTKTQAIDKKVSLLEKKIGYYHELSKSLINETVTKGLDKNVELQTNELGFATPKNWLRYRLKDLGALYSGLSGKSGDDFNQDDNLYNKGFIPFTNIANNTYLKRDHLGTVVVYEGEKQNRVRKGDIFFLMSSESYEDIGKSAALAEDMEETYLNSFCKGYRVNPRKTNPYFLNYLMLSDYYRQLLIVEGKGFTRINLKMEKVNDFLVYVPDTLSSQDEIVKFLDAKLDTIAKIITNIKTQIVTLKELRKTLINDVVTGKIKVIKD